MPTDVGPHGGVTLWHGPCAGAAGSLAVPRRLPDLPPGARTLRVHGRVGVLRPAGLPEPAPPRARAGVARPAARAGQATMKRPGTADGLCGPGPRPAV